MAATVLIVEDQMLIAWQLSDLIEAAGHRVLAIARDPVEAVEAASKERPDFALMDIRLHGGTSGIDAARMLFERWGVRSIYLSANLDPATRSQAAAMQPLGFVGKPFFPAEVVIAVERAVQAVSPA
jgi:two-component system, response regulator PdtaR